MTPGATMVPVTKALPLITASGPRIGISRSAALMPFCNGTTAVCGPTTGRICSPAVSTSHSLTQSRTYNDADAGDIVGGLSRPDMRLTAISLDTQSVLTKRREMGAARNKGHVRSGLGERGAKGSADAAGADHNDAHPILLNFHF